MKNVNVFKAQPIIKTELVESVTLHIHQELPEMTYSDLNEWRQVAKNEAQKIADVLCDSLPGGVVDALLVELLDRKRSLLTIPMSKA